MAATIVETVEPRLYNFASRMNKMKSSAVREILKVTERPDIISFAGGLPAPELFPVEAIAEAHAEVFRSEGRAALQYSTTEGWRPLREWIASRMVARGIDSHADRILITSGSQQGIDLVGKIFLEPGDSVLVENPCYLAALQCFSGYEASFIAVDSDDEGIKVDQVERALETSKPKFIYIVPDFQNPKGTTLSIERRHRLIELSKHYRVPILEDDPYGELRYRGERPPTLAALDKNGLVIHISTFSKTLSPGLRIGWVAASEEIIHALVIAKQPADLHTSTIEQRAAIHALTNMDFEGHIANLCRVYGARCDAMLASLERHFPAGCRWTNPEGGLFIWIELPERISGEELLADALMEKVAFVPGAPFYASDARSNFIRLNFSNSSEETIDEGVRRIAGAL
ncbi:MAG TPA: PLP-dependent aminotransferase family protein, partial [Blastocatellia bacterium]|nr:PLP-dependent aminotransferase family protein [Blastocatellia bacterium]